VHLVEHLAGVADKPDDYPIFVRIDQGPALLLDSPILNQ